MNAIVVFSQKHHDVDSLIQVIEQKIKDEKYISAEETLFDYKSKPVYEVDSIKLKIDFILSKLYIIQNKDEKALAILLKGLTRMETSFSSKYYAKYAYEVGSMFSKIKNYPKAKKYFCLMVKNDIHKSDSVDVSKGYLGIGSIYLRKYGEVKFKVRKGDSISNKIYSDSLMYFYEKAIDFFPKKVKDKGFLADIYSNIGGYYFFERKYDSVEKYTKLTLDIYDKLGDSLKMASTLNTLAAANIYKVDFKSAKKYYLLALSLVEDKLDYESINLKILFIKNLANLHSRSKQFEKAYSYLIKYERLNDSLNLASANEKYAEYEAKYNVTEKEKQTEAERNKRKNAEMWLYIIGVVTTLIILLVWLFYRTQKIVREKQVLVLEKEKTEQERQIDKLKNDGQIKILNATIDAKEDERRYIAEILHDSVSALLSSVGLHLQAAKIELKEDAPEEIFKAQSIVSEAGEKIRNLSHKLISSVLLKFGLSYAVEDLCEKYSNSKLKFECEFNNVERYSRDFEIKIHNIIEELVNNIIKHSKASKAKIVMIQEDGVLQLEISDNGIGFNLEKMKSVNTSGLGLSQIEARINVMEGEIEINSSIGQGTNIIIRLVIPN